MINNIMTALNHNPSTTNFLSPLGFRFLLKRAPDVEFFIQKVNIPSLSLETALVPTQFVPIPHIGEHISYGDLECQFKIDEKIANYLTIHNWLRSIGKSDTYEQFATYKSQNRLDGLGLTSDITISILSSAKVPIFHVVFHDCWPTMLSGITFDSTGSDTDYPVATAVFKYISFDIEAVV